MSTLQVALTVEPTAGRPGGDGEMQLLARVAAGDRTAAELLVERTYRSIYQALARLCGGDAELAADLTQETYRKAWASLPTFRRQAQLSTWLYRIAYTTFLNHVRRPQRLLPLDEEQSEAVRDPAPGQEELASRGAEDERLRRAVLGLPEELRYAVTARFWAGLPVEEIAAHEKVTGVAIRKRLKRAFAALALVLEEDPR